ncbi:hypothetical protein DID74_01655 [Candidatus Marinamargulisbacteria bacterium SCGC AG-333-B06]|nr:hypothetical protein DID74_01655 [Candidatus Marinamargulisbacteria bacterium SCGC AG-333-B06]
MAGHVLVTGGAGYIGSVLVPMALEAGYNVTVIDNLLYQQQSLMPLCHHNNLTLIKGDARDEALIKKQLEKADVIIPLACLVGAPLCDQDPISAQSVNVATLESILKLKSKSQQLIYPNTNSGYGIGQKEQYCDETSPLTPISLYGKLKVQAEKMILDTGEGVTFRFATVFGLSPRMRLDLLVNDFTYKAVRDRYVVLFESHFKRNYIHIKDAAASFLHAMTHYNTMKGHCFNVGLSNANLSKMELCQEIKTYIPEFVFMESDINKDPDQRDYIVSNKKIEETGFYAKKTLQDGIGEMVKAFQFWPKHNLSNI